MKIWKKMRDKREDVVVVAKKLKKDRVSLNLGKYKLNSRRNYKAFTKDWTNWLRPTKGLSGDAIGNAKLSESLFDMVEGQGISGRQAGNSGPDGEPWSRDAIADMNDIEKFFRTQNYSEEHLNKLMALDKQMDEWKNSSEVGGGSAANIKFTQPASWDSEDGSIVEYEEVYGHYLTDKYVRYRNTWKNDNLSAVPSDWYSDSPGEARPPMWQAMYAEGNFLGKNSMRLHRIIKDAIKDLQELDFELDPATPIPIEGQGSAKLALEIPEIAKMFKMMVDHEDYTTASGNFATTRAASQIKNVPIMLKTNREVNIVKRIADEMGGIPNDIEKIFITMSRRQMANMAKLAGWKPHPDSTYMKRKKREAEEAKETDEVKTSADVEETDWRTIMKVNA